jgi:hypothetical protein
MKRLPWPVGNMLNYALRQLYGVKKGNAMYAAHEGRLGEALSKALPDEIEVVIEAVEQAATAALGQEEQEKP